MIDNAVIPSTETERHAVVRKALRRILPFLFVLYMIAFLDRIALSYAGPYGMNADLGLSATVFGVASGIFTLGYVLFEVPSNLLLAKFGARKWLFRIMITWGITQALMTFVSDGGWLIAGRAVLGICEAGWAPGVLYYLTFWAPRRVRAVAFTTFLLAASVTTMIGGLISVGLINVGEILPFFHGEGWRFIFLSTGMLAVLGAVAIWFFLVDKPDGARWLSPAEKIAIVEAIESDAEPDSLTHQKWSEGLRNPKVLMVSAIFFGFNFATYVLIFFLPTIVEGFGKLYGTEFDILQRAAITGIPYLVGIVFAIVIARMVDRGLNPGLVLIVLAIIGAIGSLMAVFATNPFAVIVAMCVVCIATIGAGPVLFQSVPSFLGGAAAAVGLAMLNTIGSMGGFVSPIVAGIVIDATGSQTLTFVVMVGVYIVAAVIAIALYLSLRGSRTVAHMTAKNIV